MKLLRSKGQSFTQAVRLDGQTTVRLARGLVLKGRARRINPEALAAYLCEDVVLRLRQTISALDKTIRKPRHLRHFEIRAYEDRAKLAAALWQSFEKGLRASESNGPEIEGLRKMWLAKAHPYARKAVDPINPAQDENAQFLLKYGKLDKSRADFAGRWHRVFWRTNTRGYPDHGAIADAIMYHLHRQESILHEKDWKHRKKMGKPSEMGLLESRARTIVTGTNDPRTGRHAAKPLSWSDAAEDHYFQTDIAQQIYQWSIDPNRNKPLVAADFGGWLYTHFGAVLGKAGADADLRESLWTLHNQIRGFYQKLGKSERFRLAGLQAKPEGEVTTRIGNRKLRHDDGDRLKSLVPENKAALLRAVGAKARNADFSELIRLGKLIVHASDLPPGVEPSDELFGRRMDHFVTSEGQAEIKRNESFVRVWRNSAGYALRSLAALVDPEHKIDDDLLSMRDSIKAAKDLPVPHFDRHLSLLFGSRIVDGNSRTSLLALNDDGDRQEFAWALMRVAANVRNKTNHFMLKQRLVTMVSARIVSPPEGQIKGFDHRGGDIVSKATLERFGKLLQFDIALEPRIISDGLIAIDAGKFVDTEKAETLIEELSKSEFADDIAVPRFMSVLRKAKNLQAHATDKFEPPLPGCRTLALNNLTASSRVNQCKVGLLRLLYNSGFQNWLQRAPWLEEQEQYLCFVVQNIIDARRARKETTQEEQHLFYQHSDDWLTEAGLVDFASLNELFSELLRIGAHESETRHRYAPDRPVQRNRSAMLESFKQELIANLFHDYLDDRKLNWIWDMEAEVAEEARANFSHAVKHKARTYQEWESQLYVWLYLLPQPAVAQLRQQLRKTLILEGKSVVDVAATDPAAAEASRAAIIAMDRLMGLYARVQGAGFADLDRDIDSETGTMFFDDAAQFQRLFSAEPEHHDTSIDGTRRGLRQILRFGDMRILKPIFERHRVSTEEVDLHVQARQDDQKTQELFEAKHRLHAKIIDLCDDHDADPAKITSQCSQYEHAIVDTTLHNFSIRAARLEDHVRLHQLMMRVTGRLLDFTLMWERDRLYILLGMLYRQWRVGNEGPGMHLRDVEGEIGVGNKDGAFIKLWNRQTGYALHVDADFHKLGVELLDPIQCTVFKEHFYRKGEKTEQHGYDFLAEKSARQQRPPMKTRPHFFARGKIQIRHDFAHYNVLRPARPEQLNLTYLMNAVRSLFSHDRKMKNAVSLSIADLLESEGVTIEWTMHEDRLYHPVVLPVIETHLSMVRPAPDRSAPLLVPRSSVRFTSMVKALFDFDKGGWRMPITEEGRKKAKGPMSYPAQLAEACSYQMPQAFYRIQYPGITLRLRATS